VREWSEIENSYRRNFYLNRKKREGWRARLDRKFESKEYEDLAEKPVSAISGVSEGDADLLKKAFGIDNIRELAENKYVAIAQATVTLASLVQFLKDVGAL